MTTTTTPEGTMNAHRFTVTIDATAAPEFGDDEVYRCTRIVHVACDDLNAPAEAVRLALASFDAGTWGALARLEVVRVEGV